MNTSELLFIGIKGSVIALERNSGRQVWATHLRGADFVNVTVQGDQVLASCGGEIFCLDAANGTGLWHNPLKGFGRGLVTLASKDIPGSSNSTVIAQKRRQDEEAAAAACASM